MDARIKELWIKDLLEHPELQGRELLKTNEGKFCCLGRLCELAAAEGIGHWEVRPKPINSPRIQDAYNVFVSKRGASDTTLTPEVMAWAGITQMVYDEEGKVIWLPTLNDGVRGKHPHSYAEIAEVIREYF